MWRLVNETKRRNSYIWLQIAGILGVLALLTVTVISIPKPVVHAANNDWPMFMNDIQHDSFNANETSITRKTASSLKLHWSRQIGSRISSEPVEANGMIYWGSWDGVEHATDPSTGSDVWTVNLNQLKACGVLTGRGVLSTATVASVMIGGTPREVVIVGGGDAQLYALDANNGTIIWHTPLGSLPQHFLYDSPVVYNGSVYIGVSSYDDCPLVQGQMVKLDASTGVLQTSFSTVPNGCLGGGVWGSPTIDAAAGTLFFDTGNEGTCSTTESYTDAVIELNVNDLTYVGSWQVPSNQVIVDGDFGSTPTLFNATISGTNHQMVGLVDKNSIYYAFDRTNLSAGPLWQVAVAQPGNMPDRGQGSISSSAWNGTTLYAAGAITTINGVNCGGSIRALNPATGAFLWQVCLGKSVLAPVVGVPGLVAVVSGSHFYLINSSTGHKLFSYIDSTTGSRFWGPVSISNGMLYVGNLDGNFYAFGL